MRKTGYKRILLTFFITNLLIIFIPLAIFNIAQYTMTRQVVRNIEKATENQIRQSQQIVESRLSSAYRIATLLSSQKDILFYITKESFSPIERYNLRSVQSLLSSCANVNSGIKSLYIDLPKSNIVVSGDAVYSCDEFYGSFFRYGSYSSEDWIKKTRETYTAGEFLPLQEVATKGYQFKGSAYIKSIGGESGGIGSVIIIYDCDSVMEPLSPPDVSNSPWWGCIKDMQGRIIFESGARPDNLNLTGLPISGIVKEKEYIIVSGPFIRNNLSCVSLHKHSDAFMQSGKILAMSYIFCISAAIAGLVISIFVATSKARPLSRMAGALENVFITPQSTSINVYHEIESGVKELRVQIDTQKHALQAFYVQKLLYGKFSSQKEVMEEAAAVGFIWPENPQYVMVLRIICLNTIQKDLADDSLSREVGLLLGEYVRIYRFAYQEDSRHFIILAENRDDLREKTKKLLIRIRDILKEYPDYFVAIGIGNKFDEALDISVSYEEAQTAISGKVDTPGAALVFYEDLPVENLTYYYPIKMQAELARYVKSGDFSKADAILTAIFEKNNYNHYLSSNMTKQFIAEVCGMSQRLLEQAISPEQPEYEAFRQTYDKLADSKELAHAQEATRNLFKMLAAFFKMQMKSHNTTLIRNICAYIDAQFTDSSLSLQKIACR